MQGEQAASSDARNTPWRQGQVLPADISERLGLDLQKHYVIISHDCDLAQEAEIEPEVELIAAQVVDAANPSFRHGENPRVLHMKIDTPGGAAMIELRATNKQSVAKAVLYALEFPQASPQRVSLRLLQNWLACRYRRHALPNTLNDRLAKAYDKLKDGAKKKVLHRFPGNAARILRKK